ncbi:hypothetical protein CMO96_04310 [Candidatus Woesebacteria bacterium]|nr:hypothetical protein [Candidatus Woesebacteria bacterium]
MKKEKIQLNRMFYSRRHECYGMCIAKADFMAYMLFVKKEFPSCWYHCIELEDTCYDERGKTWAKL